MTITVTVKSNIESFLRNREYKHFPGQRSRLGCLVGDPSFSTHTEYFLNEVFSTVEDLWLTWVFTLHLSVSPLELELACVTFPLLVHLLLK